MDEKLLARLRQLMQARPDVTSVPTPPPSRPVGRPLPLRGTSPWIQELSRSPTADSLYRVGGTPQTVGDLPNPERPEGAATYEFAQDRIRMHPWQGLWQGEYNRAPNPVVTPDGTERLRSPRETYAHEIGHRGGRDEVQADAFMQAFDVLSKTGNAPSREAVLRALASVERKKPGTITKADSMLEHPSRLFQFHPGRRRPAFDPLAGALTDRP